MAKKGSQDNDNILTLSTENLGSSPKVKFGNELIRINVFEVIKLLNCEIFCRLLHSTIRNYAEIYPDALKKVLNNPHDPYSQTKDLKHVVEDEETLTLLMELENNPGLKKYIIAQLRAFRNKAN